MFYFRSHVISVWYLDTHIHKRIIPIHIVFIDTFITKTIHGIAWTWGYVQRLQFKKEENNIWQHTHTHTCIHDTYLPTHLPPYLPLYLPPSLPPYLPTYLPTCVRMYVCTYIRTYTYIYIYIYAIYIYIHIYIYNYTYINIYDICHLSKWWLKLERNKNIKRWPWSSTKHEAQFEARTTSGKPVKCRRPLCGACRRLGAGTMTSLETQKTCFFFFFNDNLYVYIYIYWYKTWIKRWSLTKMTVQC